MNRKLTSLALFSISPFVVRRFFMNRKLMSVMFALAVVCGCPTVQADTMTPISVTGFNRDMVVEVGGLNDGSAVNASLDTGWGGNETAYYEKGLFVSNPGWGLTAGLNTSATDPNTTFRLESFTADNALFFDGSHTSGTLALATPAKYSELAVFTASSGGCTLGYTIHFSDGSNSTGSLYSNDWFGAAGVAVNEHARAAWNGGTGEFELNSAWNEANGANIYQVDITGVDSAKNITSIDFTSSGSRSAVFAVSGAAVPEPASLALLATGLIGLLAYAWRKRK